MYSLGDLSGQVSSLSNPTSETVFQLSVGGNAIIPIRAAGIDGRLIRVSAVARATFDTSLTEYVTLNLYVGDPSNLLNSHTLSSVSGQKVNSLTASSELIAYTYFLYDSTAAKIYYGLNNSQLDGYHSTVGNTSDQTSLTSFRFFATGQFNESHANNAIVLTKFTIEEA